MRSHLVPRLTAALLALGGCSLLVSFDPEGKPCADGGTCLDGYVCDPAGMCVHGAEVDAGLASDAGHQSGNLDAGPLDAGR